MAIEFKVRLKEEDREFHSRSRTTMLASAFKFIGTRKAKAWREGNSPPKFYRVAADVRRRVSELTKLDPAVKVIIEREDGKRFVIVKLEPEVQDPTQGPNLGCAPALEDAHYYLLARFPRARSAGRFVCKFVSGTNTVSKHGYENDPAWHGAAEDFFFSSNAEQEVAAAHMVAGHKSGVLDLDMVISSDRFWTPEGGWQPYHGVFHSHLHMQVDGGRPCHPQG